MSVLCEIFNEPPNDSRVFAWTRVRHNLIISTLICNHKAATKALESFKRRSSVKYENGTRRTLSPRPISPLSGAIESFPVIEWQADPFDDFSSCDKEYIAKIKTNMVETSLAESLYRSLQLERYRTMNASSFQPVERPSIASSNEDKHRGMVRSKHFSGNLCALLNAARTASVGV